MKISVLDVPASVRPMSPMAKIAVNSAMKPMSLAWVWIVESMAMAAVGRRQAMTVVMQEVNLRMRLLLYVDMVGQFLGSSSKLEPWEELDVLRWLVPEWLDDLNRLEVSVEIDKRLGFFSLFVGRCGSFLLFSLFLRVCQKGSQSLAIHCVNPSSSFFLRGTMRSGLHFDSNFRFEYYNQGL